MTLVLQSNHFDGCFNQILIAGGLILTFGRGDLSDLPLFHFQPDVDNLIVDLSAVGKGFNVHRVVDNSFLRISVINMILSFSQRASRKQMKNRYSLSETHDVWIKWGYYVSSPICSDNQTECVAVYFTTFCFFLENEQISNIDLSLRNLVLVVDFSSWKSLKLAL